jgi:hypothetical protein
MTENEIIIVDNVSEQIYFDIALSAARYALISVAFTYNRMDKKDIHSRVINITKGKIAEGLFYFFCNENHVTIYTESCTTPFWLPDQKDFIFLNGEWDIKNNFIYSNDPLTDKIKMSLLPALIPNKYAGDQWSKRNETYHANTTFSAYLFTFMVLRKAEKSFFDILLNAEQLDFMADIAQQFSRHPHGKMPFLEAWFYEELSKIGPEININLKYYPSLIITGCANARYWTLFKDTGPQTEENHYKTFTTPDWYTNDGGKITNFLQGTMVTTIKNKTCPVGLLPSFSSLIHR